MKRVYIEAIVEGNFSLSQDIIERLPRRVGLVFPVQCADLASQLKEILEKNGIDVLTGKGNQKRQGQILGCDVSTIRTIKNDVDAFVYLGTGQFHPIAVALESDKPVYGINPETGEMTDTVRKEADRIKKEIKIKYFKFIHGKTIGLLISTKSGQFNMTWLNEFKKKFPDKKFYTFAFETLNIPFLDNFPFIDLFVTTACPRLQEDSPKILDFDEIRKIELGV